MPRACCFRSGSTMAYEGQEYPQAHRARRARKAAGVAGAVSEGAARGLLLGQAVRPQLVLVLVAVQQAIDPLD